MVFLQGKLGRTQHSAGHVFPRSFTKCSGSSPLYKKSIIVTIYGIGKIFTSSPLLECIIVIHFYFGTNLISVILVQAFLPKFQLRDNGCSCLFKIVWIPLVLQKFSPYRNGEFSLHRNKSGLQYAGNCPLSTLFQSELSSDQRYDLMSAFARTQFNSTTTSTKHPKTSPVATSSSLLHLWPADARSNWQLCAEWRKVLVRRWHLCCIGTACSTAGIPTSSCPRW